jgi:hypothetical protein
VLLFGAADKARLAALLGEALRPGAWVLSTAPLADARLARRQEGVHVKTSWTGGAKVDVYQVVGAPPNSPSIPKVLAPKPSNSYYPIDLARASTTGSKPTYTLAGDSSPDTPP